MVWWLRLHASNVRVTDATPGQGTKIPHAVQQNNKDRHRLLTFYKKSFQVLLLMGLKMAQRVSAKTGDGDCLYTTTLLVSVSKENYMTCQARKGKSYVSQWLSHVQLFATQRTAARQASTSITNSRS